VLGNSGSIEFKLQVASLECSPDFLNSTSLLKSMAVDLTTESDAIVGKDALL
jgi:hypothetical protein